MSFFYYRGDEFHIEGVRAAEVAHRYGTPCYVYSRAALETSLDRFSAPLAGRDAMVCYAVKANSNLAILKLFARMGSGFDIVSGGELARVLAAGGHPGRIVFSGVGKSVGELQQALSAGIFCFNVESSSELLRLDRIAGEMGRAAPVALRVNPDVDPKTHPYISTGLRSNKFGVAYDQAFDLYQEAARMNHIRLRGMACHIGSQLLDPAPVVESARKLIDLADALAQRGIELSHLDLGGGLGIRYQDESPPAERDYLAPLIALLDGRRETILFEPGRALVGNAGMLLTRVEYLKHGVERNFAIVDAAMNDLLRPALYDAWHEITAVTRRSGSPLAYEVVGPVCESSDVLGRGRQLCLAEGDLLAVMSAGAYGMAMSSNYNTRPRAAEVMVDGGQMVEIRRRERAEDLFALESTLD
jgi:diaminopimelate decarboxylase